MSSICDLTRTYQGVASGAVEEGCVEKEGEEGGEADSEDGDSYYKVNYK